MAKNFNKGCEKRFKHRLFGERICGRFEDLKHSDHYIYCEECSLKTSIEQNDNQHNVPEGVSNSDTLGKTANRPVDNPRGYSRKASGADKEDTGDSTFPVDLNLFKKAADLVMLEDKKLLEELGKK